MTLIGDFGGNAMKTVIFQTENAVFEFAQKEVTEHLNAPESEYDSDEVPKLLNLISTDSDKTILNPDDHGYFGFVTLDLIGSGIGTATCKICEKICGADQLKEFAIGHGISPFSINQKQKGGYSLFKKRKNPSMFGGKGYKCPEGHKLISMETWRTWNMEGLLIEKILLELSEIYAAIHHYNFFITGHLHEL